jgi:predicted nuclease of restriction endonuclease-like (RecB) superfamily
MSKEPAKPKAAAKPKSKPPAKRIPKGSDFSPLLAEVRQLLQSARHAAATTVNTLQVWTNFEIGRRIVEHEQKGESRAEYGAELLKLLSERLTEEFGKGFSERNLRSFRSFFIAYRDRHPAIWQKPSAKFSAPIPIGQTPSDRSSPIQIMQTPSAKSPPPFTLSWSHYVLLLTIKDPDERSFYEIEATSEGWSIPELKRQVDSSLYERLALSRNKKEVRKLAAEGQVVTRPEDVLKDPYILEFLGLDEKAAYSESDLENAIIGRIEHFLLELGKGFLFEARQRRFTFDEDHFYVDLVFYNRLLRCYVLIDLKLDKLTHQDLGQMQMYVNYYDRHIKLPEENPTIGIVLCKRNKQAVVELTLPKDANIHAREYKLYLPSKELLKKKLVQWAEEEAKS